MKPMLFLGTVLALTAPSAMHAHGGEDHKERPAPATETAQLHERYETINRSYLTHIKPIFKAKCFDCHSDSTHYPWYHVIPGLRQLIDSDIKEARKHIDMSPDFPFDSHETPLKDLESIKEVAEENEMPPLRYIIAHWDSRLSDADRKAIIEWARSSITLLKSSR